MDACSIRYFMQMSASHLGFKFLSFSKRNVMDANGFFSLSGDFGRGDVFFSPTLSFGYLFGCCLPMLGAMYAAASAAFGICCFSGAFDRMSSRACRGTLERRSSERPYQHSSAAAAVVCLNIFSAWGIQSDFNSSNIRGIANWTVS